MKTATKNNFYQKKNTALMKANSFSSRALFHLTVFAKLHDGPVTKGAEKLRKALGRALIVRTIMQKYYKGHPLLTKRKQARKIKQSLSRNITATHTLAAKHLTHKKGQIKAIFRAAHDHVKNHVRSTNHKTHIRMVGSAQLSLIAAPLLATAIAITPEHTTQQEASKEKTQQDKASFIQTSSSVVQTSNGLIERRKEVVIQEKTQNAMAETSGTNNPFRSRGAEKRKHILAIPLADRFRISSGFGPRTHPVTRKFKKMHYGVDVAARHGTNIPAPADGVVVFAGYKGSYGKTVILDHGNGVRSLYAHLSRYNVKKGDKVSYGQNFAKTGATGRVTGSHLHFEVEVNGRKINPRTYVVRQKELRQHQIIANSRP